MLQRRALEQVKLDSDIAEPVSKMANDIEQNELRTVLDEELQRLPAKYRAPLILCHLEGRTHDEAAHELGWPRGSMAKRLSRAQELLRQRLTGRGLALAAVPFTAVLTAAGAPAAVPAGLETATVKTASLFAAGEAAIVSAPVAHLAQGVLKTMLLTKLKLSIGFMLCVALIGAGALLLVHQATGAGKGDDDGAPPALPPAAQTARLVPVEPPTKEEPTEPDPNWGTIKGRLVWAADKLPESQELAVNQDKEHCLQNGKLFSEQWVVDKNSKGVRWVFVWLTTEPGGDQKLPVHPDLQEIKDKEVLMDQPCCRFEPHCLAMRAGQKLVVKNSAPIHHNFNYSGHPLRNPGRNVFIQGNNSTSIEDLKADDRFPVLVACNIHVWMRAYIRVYDHPYFAVTGKDGAFEIKHAPAGDWRLKIWHETGWRGGAAGKDGEKVTVKGGAVTDLGKLKIGS
jgi:hypothetical protein